MPPRVSRALALAVLSTGLTAPSLATAQPASEPAAKSKIIRQVARIVRIELKPKAMSYEPGKDADLELRLVDASGNPVKAPKELKIAIDVKSGDLTVYSRTVIVDKGESSESFELDIDNLKLTGPLEVAASHKELLNGGTLIYIKPPAFGDTPSFKPDPAKSKIPPKTSMSVIPGLLLPPGYSLVRTASSTTTQPADDSLGVMLDYTPKRRFLANGEDPVSVWVVLPQPFRTDVQIFLSTSAGTIEPNPIRIPAGEFAGRTVLKSDEVGPAIVTYLTSTPPTNLKSDQKLGISFRAPITGFELTVDPRSLTWIDQARVTVRLLRTKDGRDTPIATDEPRRVSLSILNGRGILAPTSIDIDRGAFEGHAELLPFASGRVHVNAAIADFIQREAAVDVTGLPYLVLLLSSVGGSIGGLIAFWTRKGSKWWRVVIGLVAGFVLYWAFIFGLLPNLSRAVVLNPLSAFALPVLGGWLGTEVFAGLTKKFGMTT